MARRDRAGKNWFSDDPIEHSTADELDRGAFVDAAIGLLERARAVESSSVLALIGPWGSGKSSILSAIATSLRRRTEPSWVVAEFNPWYYQDLASLQIGFFRELHAALPASKSWYQVRQSIAELGQSLAPLASLGSVVGLDASPAVETVAKLIGGDSGVTKVRADAEKSLRSLGRPVLMAIDDIDRLDPNELLLLFKLIRLVGRLPNVYYLIAYDEDTLLDALSRTGLVGNNEPRRAIDYLEKIVQVRLDVPPMRDEQISRWVDDAVNDLAAKFQLEIDGDFSSRFSRAYFGHIKSRLRTPRAIKRFFGQVDAFLGELSQEVDFVDFLLVSWLRTSEPLVYRSLIELRGQLLGEAGWSYLGNLSSKRDPEEDHRPWRAVLEAARVTPGRLEGVADVLSQLFPRFQREWEKDTTSYSAIKARPKRIANADYFDRYFAFGIPEEDLSDRVARSAVAQILHDESGAERTLIESVFPRRTKLILAKLEHFADEEQGSPLRLLVWLAQRYHLVPRENALADSRMRARWLAGKLYLRLRGDEPIRLLREAASAPEGLALAAHMVGTQSQEARRLTSDRGTVEAFAAAEQSFLVHIREAFGGFATTSPLELPDGLWQLVWDWGRLDAEGLSEWVRGQLDSGRWTALDLVARYVSSSISLGVPGAEWRTSGLDLANLDEVVGLEKLYEMLDHELDDAIIDGDLELPATPANRKFVALTILRRARDESRSPSGASGEEGQAAN